MIDPRELRVGNHVYDRGGKILRIDYWERPNMVAQEIRVPSGIVHPLTEEVEYLQPIPLTEQKLIDLGFEKEWEDEDAYPYFSNGLLTIFGTAHPNVFETNESDVPLKYLHKLENLHYELTGYEIQ